MDNDTQGMNVLSLNQNMIFLPTRHLWDSEGTWTDLLVQISPDCWSVCRPIGGSIWSELSIVNIDNVY